jgi:hypothetical protein
MEIFHEASGEGLQGEKVTLLFTIRKRSSAEERAMTVPG